MRVQLSLALQALMRGASLADMLARKVCA